MCPLYPRLRTFLVKRLTPGEAFGLHLSIGVALMVVAASIFGAIAADVFDGASIAVLDLRLAQWFHAHAVAGVTPLLLFITHWHSPLGVCAMTLLLALYFLGAHARYWLLTLLMAVPGGMLLNVLLKSVFRRTRPHFDDPLMILSSYSFPSGHTVAATLFYGVLAAYLIGLPRMRSSVRLAAALSAVLMVALVALSRVYLGVHYLSDVLAGAAEGCAWLTVCITASASLRRHRALRKGGKPRTLV